MMRPSPLALPVTRNFGRAYVVSGTSTGVAGSIALSAPEPDEFWLVAYGLNVSTNHYLPNYSDLANKNVSVLLACHNGASGFQSLFLVLVRPIPGRTWSTTFSFNTDSTTNLASVALKMRRRSELRFMPESNRRSNSSGTSITLTPPAYTMRRPGGLWVALAYFKPAVGVSSITGAGWESSVYYQYIGMAVCSPLERPGPVVFTGNGSAGSITSGIVSLS